MASFYFGVGTGISKWGLSYVAPMGTGIDVGLNFFADAANSFQDGSGNYLKYGASVLQLLHSSRKGTPDWGGFINSNLILQLDKQMKTSKNLKSRKLNNYG